MKNLICLTLALSLVPVSALAEESADGDTLYAIGYSMSQGLSGFALSPAEVEVVIEGIRDGTAGKPARAEPSDQMAKIRAFQTERQAKRAETEKRASAAWLGEMAKTSGAKKTDSGLIYLETRAGSGEHPTAANTVEVHYVGTLRDGREFDSSRKRGTAATFPLNGVIPCWTEALQLMKPGGTATLICPSDIAYGDRGSGPLITPGAALKFEVELISIR